MHAAARTTEEFRRAAESKDVARFLATLAPDVVVHSPLTTRVSFEGLDEVASLMHAVFASVEGMRYTDDVGNEAVRALSYRARVRGVDVQEATIVRLNDEAKIVEVTLFFRPLPALTAVMASVGPALAGQTSRGRALAARVLVTPLVWMVSLGDRVGVALVS